MTKKKQRDWVDEMDEDNNGPVTEGERNRLTFPTRYSAPRANKPKLAPGEGGARQEFREECDLNKVMEKYARGEGPGPMARGGTPLWGDFSQVSSFHEAQMQLQEAQATFDSLPAFVRSKFKNDPGLLIETLSAPDARQRIKDVGLEDYFFKDGTGPDQAEPPPEPKKDSDGK